MTVEIDDREFRQLVDRITSMSRDPAPLLSVVGETAVNLSRITFVQSEDPYGAEWAPIKHRGVSKSTETYTDRKGRSRIREIWVGGIPLRLTDTLMGSIDHAVRGQTEVVGPGVEYGIIHQLGLEHVKQRPFLPTTEKGLPQRWRSHLLDALQRKIRAVSGLT